jgi:sugar lactone lactonase YvrE
MGRDRVMRWDGSANRLVWSRRGCGPTSVAPYAGDLVILCHLDGSLVRITRAGETLATIDRDRSGRGFVNPNAAIADGKGGVYFSSSGQFGPRAPAAGAVLYLDERGGLRRLAEGIHYANGVALTADGGTLYVSEHLSRRVLAFDVDADGALSGRRVYAALDDLVGPDEARGWEVGPDGLAVDGAGNLYVAEYGAGRLLIVGPDRRLLATVAVPEPYVTAPALSADDSRLFVTAPVSLHAPEAPGKVYSVANPIHPAAK